MNKAGESAARLRNEPAEDPRYVPIRDYAAIGDCHGAALVSRSGSVDWCCLGRFDAEPVFCRMLDAERGGFFAIQPVGEFSSVRSYLSGTNILRTTYSTASGTATLTDFMPVGRQAGAGAHDYVQLNAPGWLVRIIEGESGVVPLRVRYRPSAEFARRPVQLRSAPGRLFVESGVSLYHALAEIGLAGDIAQGLVEAHAGEREVFVLAAHAAPQTAVLDTAARLLDVTRSFWEEWIAYSRYQGPYRDAVRRSALALKLLSYAPTGAIAAAATTSLPEEIGGARNWDYRYCWLRDAPFTLYALAALGYGGEARAFSRYLRLACAATYPTLQIMYGIGAEAKLTERELDHLEGYMGSGPVRTGNEAYLQRQIDVYGELLDWAYLYHTLGGKLDRRSRKMLAEFADFVAERWHEPDQGFWEMRAPARHHVHGKMMSWVALDRAIRLLGSRKPWDEACRRIVEGVCARGVDPSNGHLIQAYNHRGVDAALLLAPVLGFPLDKRALEATVAAVERELRHGDFVYRYRTEDGLQGGEGAFLICSFWLVDALVHTGRVAEAKALFERLLAHANDVGLYAEEIDPGTGAFLGNFPQAFTHLALIGAAVHLELCDRHGPRALDGSYADRARLVVGATLGWRALWAAFKATRRVGRVFSSRRSVLRTP
ncbi:MAG: glycoside hydrolase family 15 protein [Betaproteobacteria bacterium]